MTAAYPTEEARLAARRATHRRHGEKRRQDAEYRETQKGRYRDWQEKNGSDPDRLARKAAQMRGYSKDPALRLKHIARWLVNRRIKNGKLIPQPCEVCGAAEVHGHHDDYSKPLEVRWLCPEHHREHHAKATGVA